MKCLYSYNGKLRVVESHEPLGSVNDIIIANHFSAFSTGTESSRIRAQALRTRVLSKGFLPQLKKVISLRPSLPSLLQKGRKFFGYYERLGYSSVGQVVSIGSNVSRSFSVGDLVVAGGESANHSEIVAVSQGLVEKISAPEFPASPLFALSFLMSIPLHSLHLLQYRQTERLLILGGGLIGALACTAAKYHGVDFRFLDLRPDSLCHTLFPMHSLTAADNGFSAVLCSAPSLAGINDIIETRCIKGMHLNVLGEASLAELDKQTIEEQYGTVTFCNSFGYGRRIWSYEKEGKVSGLAFPYTIQHNVQNAIEILSALPTQKLFRPVLQITPIERFSPDPAKIGLIQYAKSHDR